MADTLTKKQRSWCMSRIKSRNTKPEAAVRKLIWSWGYRYRIGHGLPGKPDMVFPGKSFAAFIDGCFWHACPRHCRMPSSNTKYWREKISGNRRRDKKITRQLRRKGWRVIRVWEHEVRADPEKAARRIISRLQKAKRRKA